MISFLSAVVFMVALGTVIHGSVGFDSLFRSGSSAETIVAVEDDRATVYRGRISAIDVLANDTGLTEQQRRTLAIVELPTCGQVLIQRDLLRFRAGDSCPSPQSFSYKVRTDGGDRMASVTAIIADPPPAADADTQGQDNGDATAQTLQGAAPARIVDADGPSVAREHAPVPHGPRGTQQADPEPSGSGLSDVLANGGADPVAAAEANPLDIRPKSRALSGGVGLDTDGAAAETAAMAALAPADRIDPVGTRPAEAEQAPARAMTPSQPVGQPANVPNAPPNAVQPRPEDAPVQAVPDGTASPAQPLGQRIPSDDPQAQPFVLQPPISGPTVGTAGHQPAAGDGQASAPATQGPTPQAAAPDGQAQPAAALSQPRSPTVPGEQADGSRIALTPVPRFDPGQPTQNARIVTADTAIDTGLGASPRVGPAPQITGPNGDDRIAPVRIDEPARRPASDAPNALGVRNLIDLRAPPVTSERIVATSDVSEEMRQLRLTDPEAWNQFAALGPALSADPVDRIQAPLVANTAQAVTGEAEDADRDDEAAGQVAALQGADQACLTPPATVIDVGRAAQSTVFIEAPCHANSLAELHYSGLRLAVPLNREGQGNVVALGFEPNAPALLVFPTGEQIDFDLPFKGLNRISRVALVWDLPVTLELNALEFGAETGTQGHVSPGNPRKFSDVRRNGGGFLKTYRAYGGVGQNAQIYTHYHRRGGQTGIVEMRVDYASRSRDRLDGTCGDGPFAAPRFEVLRSNRGRIERNPVRRLAPIRCSQIASKVGDNALIKDAIESLIVSQ